MNQLHIIITYVFKKGISFVKGLKKEKGCQEQYISFLTYSISTTNFVRINTAFVILTDYQHEAFKQKLRARIDRMKLSKVWF